MPSTASSIRVENARSPLSTTKANASIAERYCVTFSCSSTDVVFSSSMGATVKISIPASIPKPKNAFAFTCALAKLANTLSATASPSMAIATATVVNGVA